MCVNLRNECIVREWGSKLKTREVKLSDAGSYTCVANNSVGTARLQTFLFVNGMLAQNIFFWGGGVKMSLKKAFSVPSKVPDV